MFVENEAGELAFHPADRPHAHRPAAASQGVIADDDVSVVTADAALEDKEPALAALAAASVTGTADVSAAQHRVERGDGLPQGVDA